jgi:hypothetical protein
MRSDMRRDVRVEGQKTVRKALRKIAALDCHSRLLSIVSQA